MITNIEDILKLSKSERILIVEKIWDSIADDTEGSGLPE
jgi:putative addiction module component (TIGR02574 family)